MPVVIQGGARPPQEVEAELQASLIAAASAWAEGAAARVRAEWSGWQNPTGRSQAGWRAVPASLQGSLIIVGVENPVPYVPYVHRRGVGIPEVDRIERDLLPSLTPDLLRALADAGAAVPLTRPL